MCLCMYMHTHSCIHMLMYTMCMRMYVLYTRAQALVVELIYVIWDGVQTSVLFKTIVSKIGRTLGLSGEFKKY